MKTTALLLAAGLGTRLRPITYSKPKCLVEVGGIPILEHWLRKLEECKCERVVINTHYLAGQVEEYLEGRRSSGMEVIWKREKEILGTAGSLREYMHLMSGETTLLVHADNLMCEPLDRFLRAHLRMVNQVKASVVCFRTDSPRSCGIMKVDRDGIIREYEEKPTSPKGDLANGAIFALSKDFINEFEGMEPRPYDFCRDVVPRYVDRMYAWKTVMPFVDVGTSDSLRRANQVWNSKW